ncbi:MAG: PfkB family carbohydrate kinase [Firmicutes bacterium]|nr:PfkB family carbohydrate kinase [Bacillota bacterium]
MRSYDMMILGPSTWDENIDYTGQVVRDVGGAVTFCTPAARAAGARVFAAVKIAPEDRDILSRIPGDPEDAALLPSARTTLMRNEYFTADRERRNSSCPAQSDPITPEEVPPVPCKLYHLAGLLYGDFPNALLESLHAKGLLSADAQGFLRHNEGGKMVFHDWADKGKYLPYLDFLKTDAAEAEILTGLSDRRAAAKQLYDWGAKEILISHNSEMLVYDGRDFYTCPVKARNLSGRTGRGDTTFGAYLAMRVTGAGIPEALRYATACVSLKMETPGIFRGTRADVEAYIREFYL